MCKFITKMKKCRQRGGPHQEKGPKSLPAALPNTPQDQLSSETLHTHSSAQATLHTHTQAHSHTHTHTPTFTDKQAGKHNSDTNTHIHTEAPTHNKRKHIGNPD
jgi:hypothetical protein